MVYRFDAPVVIAVVEKNVEALRLYEPRRGGVG